MDKQIKSTSLLNEIRNHKLVAVLIGLLWVFLFMTTVSKTWFYYERNNLEMEFGFFFLRAFLIWGLAAAFVPIIFWLCRKLPLDGDPWPAFRNGLFHLLLCLLFLPLFALTYRALIVLIYSQSEKFSSFFELQTFLKSIANIGIIPFLIYGLTVIGVHLKRFYSRYKERHLRTAELEAELTSVNLSVLKNQLRPHFLFNTLHNINALMHENPQDAKKILQLLKRLLRHSFHQSDLQTITLAKELEFTSIYLEIEKIRFYDRLNIQLNIQPETLDALVPSLLIQPLTENAVRHGISKKIEMGTIYVTSKKVDRKLQLIIEDDGPGLGPAAINGIGLGNSRKRLHQMYNNHRFFLSQSDYGGLRVFIEIPFIEEESYEKDKNYYS